MKQLITTALMATLLTTASAETDHSNALKAIQKAQTTTNLEKALAQAREILPQIKKNIFASRELESAIEAGQKADSPEVGLQALHRALKEAEKILTFKPLIEAKLPKGFPQPTPVGEIEIKKFPSYRMARTKAGSGRNGAFMKLFFHIQRNNIKMTAPVEMTYEKGPKQRNREKQMAFLYQNRELGSLGKSGAIEVTDFAPMTAVSIGIRGNMSPDRVAEAQNLLEQWLKQNAKSYRAAGPLRVMGYNSPMVPSSRRYNEVQIPVEPVLSR